MDEEKLLKNIKQELIKRKLELEAELEHLYKDKIADDQVQDPGDQALISSMENVRNALQETERDEYVRIIKALQMIEDGTYGICVDCGQPISEKRLKSYPNASRCLSCQEVFEETGGVV